MFATMGDFELNGEPPDLSGKICQGLYREEYWFEGDLIEPATILYLKFDGQWHRLYFDFGIIFWRLEDELPESFDVPEEGWSFKMIDVNRTIPVVGRCLEQYYMQAGPYGPRVVFEFEGDLVFAVENINDVTHFSAAGL